MRRPARSITADPRLFETAQCLCLASRRAARAITRRFDAAMRPCGIRATQFTLLAALELKGPQPVGALAAFLGAERTTLTRNLAVAEEMLLVTLRPGEDARARIAAISARGRQTLKRALPAWRSTQAELTRAMGVQAADSLRRLSRRPAIRKPSRENGS